MSLLKYEFTNWKFREHGSDSDWLPSADTSSSTTEIFPDLISNNIIKHPFKNDNEQEVQWVGTKDWEYVSTLEIGDVGAQFDKAQLVFQGLDTFADVYFDNKLILSTENQFREYSVDLDFKDLSSGYIEIKIVLHSVLRRAADKPFDPKSLLPLESSRVFVRKAQYNYGWDWGPILVTSGIFKPVSLVLFRQSKIKNVFVDYEVTNVAEKVVEFKIKSVLSHLVNGLGLKYELSDVETGKVLWHDDIKDVKSIESSTDKHELKLSLWYPFTHGDQSQYKLNVELVSDSGVLDQIQRLIGFRKVELVQESLKSEEGSSFYFKINDIPAYINGTNWIPASSFPTTVTNKDYTDWLLLQKEANQNMLRIWGGGLYEYDHLYEEADRLGILIWQDFLFACAQYPGDDEFTENVKKEAHDQLSRLRNYSSVVIYAGNNEDYQTKEEYSIPDDEFYARDIYEKVLPDLVKELHPNAEYIFGSPWSPDGKPAGDLTVGDAHQWNVWHGEERPYQDWHKLAGRFVSEFGMQALPNIKTYKETIDDETELHPQSRLVELHNKAAGFEKKLSYYVFTNLKLSSLSLESWIYATQLVQAESHTFALRSFRRRWGHDGDRLTSGQLVWQLNDTYPVASWALVDHYKRPKLGYYAIKRESAPIVIGIQRYEESAVLEEKERGSDLYSLLPKIYYLDFWVSNASLESKTGELLITLYDVSSSSVIKTEVLQVEASRNATVELISKFKLEQGSDIVALAEFKESKSGELIAAASDWPQPLKYLKFDTGSKVQYELGQGYIKLWSDAVIKAVDLEVDDVLLDDNGFDIFPNRPVVLKGPKINEKSSVSLNHYR